MPNEFFLDSACEAGNSSPYKSAIIRSPSGGTRRRVGDLPVSGPRRESGDHAGKSFGLTPLVLALPPRTTFRVSVQMVDWVVVVVYDSSLSKRL
ncbi:hypothetical protein SAMN05216276_10263 [Streptosporangium subroseum]|uniref:Uncharacterized protein n=1 Tax=Streptosporangium subroseum TaxID=106412 RepID=A0A239K6K8_9ACTN|nr:hypothetical protein SAMN05216276_10263 [Streptosporangium subroseum]